MGLIIPRRNCSLTDSSDCQHCSLAKDALRINNFNTPWCFSNRVCENELAAQTESAVVECHSWAVKDGPMSDTSRGPDYCWSLIHPSSSCENRLYAVCSSMMEQWISLWQPLLLNNCIMWSWAIVPCWLLNNASVHMSHTKWNVVVEQRLIFNHNYWFWSFSSQTCGPTVARSSPICLPEILVAKYFIITVVILCSFIQRNFQHQIQERKQLSIRFSSSAW